MLIAYIFLIVATNIYDQMLLKTEGRTDMRSSELPERIGDYLYYSKMKVWNGLTINNVYRCDLDNRNETLILDSSKKIFIELD